MRARAIHDCLEELGARQVEQITVTLYSGETFTGVTLGLFGQVLEMTIADRQVFVDLADVAHLSIPNIATNWEKLKEGIHEPSQFGEDGAGAATL